MHYIYGPQTDIFGSQEEYYLATSPTCIKHLQSALYAIGIAPEKVQVLRTPQELISLKEANPIILFPGGHALSLMISLRHTHAKIHELVKNGASIIGICAGSIVVSDALVEKNTKSTPRRTEPGNALFGGPIGLSKAASIAPVYQSDKIGCQVPKSVPIQLIPSQEKVQMYFHAGVQFEIPEGTDGHEILARYEDTEDPKNAIAAWHARLEKGTVSAFGFHPEIPLPGAEEPNSAGLALLKAELAWIAAHRQKDEAGSADLL